MGLGNSNALWGQLGVIPKWQYGSHGSEFGIYNGCLLDYYNDFFQQYLHYLEKIDSKTWEFVNSIVEFNRYTNSPVANYKGKLYNLPFNMNTFY